MVDRGDFVLKEKLYSIKVKIEWWSYLVFGRIDVGVEYNVREMNEADDNVMGEM